MYMVFFKDFLTPTQPPTEEAMQTTWWTQERMLGNDDQGHMVTVKGRSYV